MTDGFIPEHGGFKNLRSYQKAVIVYDATVRFCDRFIAKHDPRPPRPPRSETRVLPMIPCGKFPRISRGKWTGFSRRNVFYVREFFATYKDLPKVQPLVAQIAKLLEVRV